MQRTLAGVRGSIRHVTSDFDRLQGSITGTIGRISNLYGMLAGGAAVYGFNRGFIRPAAEMETYMIRLNSLYKGIGRKLMMSAGGQYRMRRKPHGAGWRHAGIYVQSGLWYE